MSSPTEVAGRYQLGRRLGAGGMSTVFLALDRVLERDVAVKLLAEHLADDEAFVTRFRHEALAAARLQHPNIVQVYDSGQDADSGRHFIVMEYVEGPSAADLLRENGQLEVEQAVRIASEACHGLDYAHRQGVVHRDVKPGNLLIVGETGALKLADFGIAKATEQTRITQAGSVLGTAAYLSPEQAQGHEAGPQSDVYSLGVCTYQFLTGRLPHEYGSLTELAMKQQNESAQPIVGLRPEVPAELDRAVRVCLEPDLDVRYGSALEMAEAVDAGWRGEETEATVALASAPERSWSEDDATESTRALPASRPAAAPSPRRSKGPPPPPPPRRARDPRAERRQDRARRLGTFLILVAVALLAAIVVVLLTQGGGEGFDRVVEESVREQVTELKELIRQNTE